MLLLLLLPATVICRASPNPSSAIATPHHDEDAARMEALLRATTATVKPLKPLEGPIQRFRARLCTLLHGKTEIDIVVSGGALRGYFLLGARHAIEDRGDLEVRRYSGTSAGAWAAMLMATGVSSGDWLRTYTLTQAASREVADILPLSSSLEKMHGGQVAKAANVTGHVSLPTNSYEAMMSAVVQGPLAVSVDAGAWHDYESGVFNGGNHTNPTLDHLVQLVGYGTDPITGMDYWIIRNSWTPLWGEEGFMRLLRSSNATCGLDMKPGDGDGCTGGPKQVKVCGQSGILYDGVYPLV